MTPVERRRTLEQEATLLDLVDRLLEEGVVLAGDITLGVAGVDLVYLGLRAVLTSVETMEQESAPRPALVQEAPTNPGGDVRNEPSAKPFEQAHR